MKQYFNFTPKQKRVFGLLLFLSVVILFLSYFPNRLGADDPNMLSVFMVDEYAQYPHVVRMIANHGSLKAQIKNFIAYQHYFYGFPFYSFSALTILPIKLAQGGVDPTAAYILALRQVVSALPMLAAILLWVKLQTNYDSYIKSIGLFLFLCTIPAVFENNFWWHPDSLAFLFITLTVFFIVRDNFAFRRNFVLAAIFCGLAIGTKMIGVFFFLAIPTYLFLGWQRKKITLKQTIRAAFVFVLVMAATAFISNPIALTTQGRADIWRIQRYQANAMAFGFDVAYEKGIGAWLPMIRHDYGSLIFIFVAFGTAIYAFIRNKDRKLGLLNLLILLWVTPYTLYLLLLTVSRQFHVLLSIAIPLFSSIIHIFPSSLPKIRKENWLNSAAVGILLLIVIGQFSSNLSTNFQQYTMQLDKVTSSEAIQFYNRIDQEILAGFPEDDHTTIFRDVTIYLPADEAFDVRIKWGVIDLDYIQELSPDLIVLSNQRIADYGRPALLETNLAGDALLLYQFYSLAREGNLPLYTLIYQDDFGKVFQRIEE